MAVGTEFDVEENSYNVLASNGEIVFYSEFECVKVYVSGRHRLALVEEIFDWAENNQYEVDLLGGHDSGDGNGYYYRWGIRDSKQRFFFNLAWQ